MSSCYTLVATEFYRVQLSAAANEERPGNVTIVSPLPGSLVWTVVVVYCCEALDQLKRTPYGQRGSKSILEQGATLFENQGGV